MWLKAWGKLPSSSPLPGSTSSDSHPAQQHVRRAGAKVMAADAARHGQRIDHFTVPVTVVTVCSTSESVR